MREKLTKIIEATRMCRRRWAIRQSSQIRRNTTAWPKSTPTRSSGEEGARVRAGGRRSGRSREMLADPDMKEFALEEIAGIEAKLPALEEDIKFMLIPADPADDKDIIVEIRAAAGGDEAAIFAGELYKMYERFASAQGWKTETMDMSASEAGGFKEIQFKVKGDHVYSVMKFESGVHRVQRVPKTESQGRIHTSTATVAVLPEADEVEVEINENDLRIDVYRAGGPGGQCVNTTDSAVRITHLLRASCAVAGSEVAAAEQDRGHGRAARPSVREDVGRAAGRRGREAPRADRIGRPLREDPHVQRPAGPRDRPPHRLQRHVQRRASGRRPGRRDHRSAGRRPRAEAGSRGLRVPPFCERRNLPTLRGGLAFSKTCNIFVAGFIDLHPFHAIHLLYLAE